MADYLLLFVICVTFALMLTMQVSIVAALIVRRNGWMALLAALVPLVAPYAGYVNDMRKRASTWVVSALFYAIAVGLSLWRS